MRLFRKKAKKYEFCVLTSHEGYVESKVEKLQKDGWILAGDCYVKHHGTPTNATFLYIPFKRLITGRKGKIV